MKKLLPILLLLPALAAAQVHNFQFPRMGGSYYASSFVNWKASTSTPIAAPGLATFQVSPSTITPVANDQIQPAAAGVPLLILGSPSEVVTPVSVNCGVQLCSVTATFTYAHPGGFTFTSASGGLDEAIGTAAAQGGGTVIVGSDWPGTTAQIIAAAGNPAVSVLDTRAGANVRYAWNGNLYQIALGVNAGGAVQAQSIEGVVYADQFPGSDMGTRINAAEAALPGGCGTVRVPAGMSLFATTIIKPRCVWIVGDAPGTTLTFTPSSGTAIAVGDSGSGTAYARGGISRIKMVGSGSAIGLWLGGDPAGVVLPSGDFGDGQMFYGVELLGFGTGIEWGNNAWLESFYSINLHNGATGIGAAAGATNSSENNIFFGGAIYNMSGAAVAQSEDLQFVGVSFDFNGAPSTGGMYTACHFEQQTGVFISGVAATIDGGAALLDATPGTDSAMFHATGVNAAWTIRGLSVFSGHAVSNLVDWSAVSGADASLRLDAIYGNGNHTIAALTNASSAFGIAIHNTLAGEAAQPTLLGGTLDSGAIRVRDSAQTGNWSVDLFDDQNASDTAPHKFLRTNGSGGNFQILNNAASAVELQLTDAGSLSWGGGAGLASSNSTGSGLLVLSASPTFSGTPIFPATYTTGGNTITQPSATGTLALTSQLPFSGSVAGSTTSLPANSCGDAVTTTVTGATTGMVAAASGEGALPSSGLTLQAAVTAANTVTVEYCNISTAAVVPATLTIAVRVIQ